MIDELFGAAGTAAEAADLSTRKGGCLLVLIAIPLGIVIALLMGPDEKEKEPPKPTVQERVDGAIDYTTDRVLDRVLDRFGKEDDE